MNNPLNLMAMKSDKSKRRKRDNVGCLSGLIELFNFGKDRFTRKLLRDGKARISEKNGHGGTSNLRNKIDLPSNSEEKKENIDLDVYTNIPGKYTSNKDGNRAELPIKHTTEKSSGYNVDIEKKTRRVTSQSNKLMDPQSQWSDLMVELCKEQNTQSNDIGIHGCFHGKIPTNMILKYFDPKQIKTDGSSHALQHIVVLKPNKQHEETGHSSRFSFNEIKRRMKEINRETKNKPNSITMDSVLHKIPYGSPNFIAENEKAVNTRQSTKLATLLQRQESEPNTLRRTVSFDEGRQRLADMLHFGKISSPRQPLKSLGRVLSFPGFDSPSPMLNSQLPTQINNSSSCLSMKINSEDTQPMAGFDVEDSLRGKDNWKGFSTDELDCDNEICNEEETQRVSDFLLKALESTANIQENDPTALSIVEPVPDDDESISKQRMLKNSSVCEGSGLNYNGLPDELLDPSVFDELEINYRQLSTDSKIFWDYIDEVFIEVSKKFSRSTPWISLIKPDIKPTPTREIFMQELCKGVDRYVHKDFSYTLDHITEIDLEHEDWMNIKADIEDVVTDIADEILDDIMEGIAFELINSI